MAHYTKGYGPTGVSFTYSFDKFKEDVAAGKVHTHELELITETDEAKLQALFDSANCFGYTGRKKFVLEPRH